MKALGYNPHVAIQIALAGNAADLIKHHDRAAQRGEQLRPVFVRGVQIVFGFGKFVSYHFRTTSTLWLGRFSNKFGIKSEPADQGPALTDAVGQFMGCKTAVTHKDDLVARKPPSGLEHALPGPVSEFFVPQSSFSGMAFKGV